jgi:hypothetical protein
MFRPLLLAAVLLIIGVIVPTRAAEECEGKEDD